MTTASSPDFLSLDRSAEQRAAQNAKAKEYAQLYVAAFVRNPAGAQLLADWKKALLFAKRLNATSSHTQFAWEEARRVFVLEILEQIELASTIEGPKPK